MKIQPGQQGLITFATLQQCRDAYREFIKPILDKLNIPFSYNESFLNLTLANGSVYHFRSAEKDVVKRVETLQYAWWWGDECQSYSLDALKVFNSRVRKGQMRRRICAMPEEPNHYLYSFLKKIEAYLYELNLFDNPDKDFVRIYEKNLKQTYTGVELDRYLYGKRVSLVGMGIFGIFPSHQKKMAYDYNSDIVLVWDFNVEYCAVAAWQLGAKTQSGQVVQCLESFQLKKSTAYENALDLICRLAGVKELNVFEPPKNKEHLVLVRKNGVEKLISGSFDGQQWNFETEFEPLKWGEIVNKFEGRIILQGDASGDNRTAATSDSMWHQVRAAFVDVFKNQVFYQVEKRNPPVKDTIQCANWALNRELIQFDKEKALSLYNSVSAAKFDKHGEIDKSKDYKEASIKSHEADVFRYAAWHFFKFKYPGANRVGIYSI